MTTGGETEGVRGARLRMAGENLRESCAQTMSDIVSLREGVMSFDTHRWIE